ncbi:MAG: TonB-dependent receptor plug domain-containing protein [Limisphaerales bacterium]
MSPYLHSSPARSLFLLAALSGAPKVLAADPSAPSAAPPRGGEVEAPVVLPDILVRGRGDSLLGVASSASQGTVGSLQIDQRPTLRAGEVLETVPGVIVTQHAGGGKANQMFLRGFNLDHGTDFATSLDGMPVNLPTHGHGQGYTDLNIVIPELIDRVNFQKGVYDAAIGDFGSAGAARIETFRVLPQSLAILEGGMYGNARAVFASSPRLGNGHLLYGVEAYHHDGPWVNPDDYQKFNGLLTYSMGDDSLGSSVTLRGYHGRWDSSDQVAASAIDDGIVPFFGSLDDTTGGESQRYSLQAEWHRADDAS